MTTEILDLPLDLASIFSAEVSENIRSIEAHLEEVFSRLKLESHPEIFLDLFSSYPTWYSRFIALKEMVEDGTYSVPRLNKLNSKNFVMFLLLHGVYINEEVMEKYHNVPSIEDVPKFLEHLEESYPSIQIDTLFQNASFLYQSVIDAEEYASITDWFIQTFEIDISNSVGNEYKLREILSKILESEEFIVKHSLMDWFSRIVYGQHEIDVEHCATPLLDESMLPIVSPEVTDDTTGERFALDFTEVDSDEADEDDMEESYDSDEDQD